MSERATRIIETGVAVVVGLFLAVTGLAKLLDVPKLADSYQAAGHPRWVFFASGVIELFGGLGLLLPRVRHRAAWVLLGMIFLVAWAPWKVHELFFLVPQVAMIGGLIFLVASVRRPA